MALCELLKSWELWYEEQKQQRRWWWKWTM